MASVTEAIAKLRKMKGVRNFNRDGPPTETSVSFKDRDPKVLPPELWVALRNLSNLHELSFYNCTKLEALTEGTHARLHSAPLTDLGNPLTEAQPA